MTLLEKLEKVEKIVEQIKECQDCPESEHYDCEEDIDLAIQTLNEIKEQL